MKDLKILKEKFNNVVLLFPGEHNKWDKKCPYCNSVDIQKNCSLQFKS